MTFITDYRKDFNGLNEGDSLGLYLNYMDGHGRPSDNEIFIDLDSDGDNAYLVLNLETAKAARDHLSLLIEKATYRKPVVFEVDPIDPSEYISLPVAPSDGDKFDFRKAATSYTTNTANFEVAAEPAEFDVEKIASQMNDLWEALVDKHAFEQSTADKFVVAAIKSGLFNS